MYKVKSFAAILIFLALANLALAGCAQNPAAPSTAIPTLKIAVLPVLDVLPMYVAQQEGLFTAHHVNVTFIPAGSAPERDQLITSGQADGMINEALSTMFYNKDKVQVQIVHIARAATADVRLFSILAAGNSGITSVAGLKGVEVGISQGTVIEYLNDRLLRSEGLAPAEIKTVAVPKIDLRMQMLGSGELKAAMLPEPSTSLAVQQGARVILDDTRHPEYSFSTISFRKETIDQHPQEIRDFLAAFEEAVSRINANPSKYNDLLSQQKLVPTALTGAFQVPKFSASGVPSQAQWNDVLAWAKEKGLVKTDLPYLDSVNASFLPK